MSVPVEVNQNLLAIRIASKAVHDNEIIWVNKQLIMEKSGYFRTMCLRNPLISSFTLNCDEKLFKIAIHVINGNALANAVKDLDTLFCLAAMAEILQMDELKEACVQLMAKTVNFQTVWKIYDTNHAPVIENCEWLLKTRTKDLLAHPHFMNIKPETLARFLSLEEMNIESETVLLEAILRYTSSGMHGSSKDVFRKYALPYLRVHNLEKSDYYTLQVYLFPEEFPLFPYLMDSSEKPAFSHLSDFCLDTRPRRSENSRVLVIEPDKDIYDSADLIWSGPHNLFSAQKNKFVLSFVTKRRIMLQRIFFFCPLLMWREPIDEFFINVQLVREPGGISLPNFTVASSFKIFSPSQVGRGSVIEPSNMNKIAFMKLNVDVPEAARVSIEIEFDKFYHYHRIAKSEATIFESSVPNIQEVLENVSLRHMRDGQETNEEFIPTIFKSVHINII